MTLYICLIVYNMKKEFLFFVGVLYTEIENNLNINIGHNTISYKLTLQLGPVAQMTDSISSG